MATQKKTSSRGVVIVTVVILVLFTGWFVREFIIASQKTPVPTEALTADSYMTEVSTLLENADAARGEVLVNTKYECHSCHIQGAGQIAPAFTGLDEHAATRRPPLTGPAYLYESIANPMAFLVEKEPGETYPPAMPINYLDRLTQQELGDIIAYLMTQ